jgi:hypothetical protein
MKNNEPLVIKRWYAESFSMLRFEIFYYNINNLYYIKKIIQLLYYHYKHSILFDLFDINVLIHSMYYQPSH